MQPWDLQYLLYSKAIVFSFFLSDQLIKSQTALSNHGTQANRHLALHQSCRLWCKASEWIIVQKYINNSVRVALVKSSSILAIKSSWFASQTSDCDADIIASWWLNWRFFVYGLLVHVCAYLCSEVQKDVFTSSALGSLSLDVFRKSVTGVCILATHCTSRK